MKITRVMAREIFDSRGWPTIECELILDESIQVNASVPSGLSKGPYEAVELRDGEERLFGLGVQQAVEKFDQMISPLLIGRDPSLIEMDIELIELDGTENKANIGANAMLAASMAICKAQAITERLELFEFIAYLCGFETVSVPCPLFNVINGGVHANNKLRLQEIMIMPVGLSSFHTAMDVGDTIYQLLKEKLKKAGKSVAVGDEGGFSPDFKDEHEALDLLMAAIQEVELNNEASVMIVIDMAASQFYDTKLQKYKWNNKKVTGETLIAWYEDLIRQYPIYAIEDGLGYDDWESWQIMVKAVGSKIQVVGDDLFATNPNRIWHGINQKAATAAVVKPNQIGTITEALQAAKLCKEYDCNIIVSHRSGETNDSFIADLAVGTSAGHIKAGGCSRGERMSKYNRLLMIEDMLLLSF
jgi:enolase